MHITVENNNNKKQGTVRHNLVEQLSWFLAFLINHGEERKKKKRLGEGKG